MWIIQIFYGMDE
jgi:hypothetical protein